MRAYIYIVYRKMHGSLLRAIATYCAGIAECSITTQADPLPKGRLKSEMREKTAMTWQKKRSRDEDGEVQDLAVLKRIKRSA